MKLVVGFGVLAALGLTWWFQSFRVEAADAVDADRLVVVETADLIDSVTASGRVEPLARVAVMSRASGIIKELFVEEGDVVEVGQVLAELDREQLEAQHAQDEAGLLAAEARVQGALARVAEARVRLDDPELEYLEKDVERLTTLLADGNVSQKEHDDVNRALVAARFRVAQVEANLPILEAAVAEARAGLASARAELERSETGLREATIRCPMDGVVLVRDKEIGDGISSILTAGGNATQLMTLGDLSKMHIEARVDEVDLGRIYQDMPVLVTVDAFRGRVLEGSVERIAPAGSIDDNGIVTFEVRIAVEDPDKVLRPDMTADSKLVLERRDGTLVLPQIALARGEGDSWTALRVSGEGEAARAQPVTVELGISDGLMTEILSGLAEGDRILLPSSRGGGR